jgi:glucose-6-phosphate isomerase
VKTILHIGIGGSDLGPRLIWDALRDYNSNGPQIRFVANVDPEDFAEQTAGLDAKTTLVLVVSKSFKTPETASNAQLGHEWLVKAARRGRSQQPPRRCFIRARQGESLGRRRRSHLPDG